MSEVNPSESIVYIEYSQCYEEHTKLYYTYFKLFIVSWYFFNFFKLLEWILNGLAAEAIQCLFFLQYTAIYSNLSSYFLKSDLFLKQNRTCSPSPRQYSRYRISFMHTWKMCYHSNQQEGMVNCKTLLMNTWMSLKHFCRNLLFLACSLHSLVKRKHTEESYRLHYGIRPSQLLALVNVTSLQM